MLQETGEVKTSENTSDNDDTIKNADKNEKQDENGPEIGFKCTKVSSKKIPNKSFKITLPISMLTYSEADCTCPVAFCRKKIPKNRSIETHMRQHLNLIFHEVNTKLESGTKEGKVVEQEQPEQQPEFDVQYHCPDKACKYSDVKDIGHFLQVKYLKQHYVKVHAPKDFKCSKCQKTFASATLLGIHEAMCGITFVCSCERSYTSLEALQTHARRKKHSFDVTKYKKLLSVEKSRIQETKASKLATTEITNAAASSKLPKTSKYQVLLPKADLPTVIDFTNHPEIQFGMIIGELPIPCRTKIDFGTQTVSQPPSQHQQQQLNNSTSNNKRSSFSMASSSGDGGLDSSDPLRLPKRKKSAETQTARYRVRISTETQTTNVVKRRRSTRKKQSVEAETQCHHEVGVGQSQSRHVMISSNANSNSTTTTTATDTNNVNTGPVTKKVDIGAKLKLLDSSYSSPCPTKESYSSITHPISEFDSNSFFTEMEEVHIQTQTEPDLLYLGGSSGVGVGGASGETIFSEYDVHVNLNDDANDDVTNFLNFVTTETQTANPTQFSTDSHHQPNNSSSSNWPSFMDSTTSTATTSTATNVVDCEIQTALTTSTEEHSYCNNNSINDNFQSVNTSYLETMDNETQTQFYDFLSKMFE